jgi:hypothetical protein
MLQVEDPEEAPLEPDAAPLIDPEAPERDPVPLEPAAPIPELTPLEPDMAPLEPAALDPDPMPVEPDAVAPDADMPLEPEDSVLDPVALRPEPTPLEPEMLPLAPIAFEPEDMSPADPSNPSITMLDPPHATSHVERISPPTTPHDLFTATVLSRKPSPEPGISLQHRRFVGRIRVWLLLVGH